MGVCSNLALQLDFQMLTQRGVAVAPASTPDQDLIQNFAKTGHQAWDELGGRFVLRYLTRSQVGTLAGGVNRLQYVTPTPFSAEETVKWLALPSPSQPREFVLLLDPRMLATLCGPRLDRLGNGLEYLLPQGFPDQAVVNVGGLPGTGWALVVC